MLSVILCTYNPRRDYLSRTLEALRRQDFPAGNWELIIVDNNSSPPLISWLETNGFPPVRIVIEPEQGFTPALIRGISLASGEVCVLVHDDNLLAPEYLTQVCRIALEWPQLGAWGGGYDPEYEELPAPQLTPFLAYLAVNPVTKDRWSNQLYDYAATPCGAGMAVRSDVIQRWAELTSGDARRRSLGRHTDKLTSCEDFDIAFTAIDVGYGTGVFTCLRLTHLIPKERVQFGYLRRLVEGHGYSSVLLHSFRGQVSPHATGLLARIRRWRQIRRLGPVERELRYALRSGEDRAFALLDRMKQT